MISTPPKFSVPIADLRIGNYYSYNTEPIKLDGSTLSSYLINELEFKLFREPLTEDWLIAFGFDKHEFGYCKRYRDDNGLSDYLLISLDDFECETFFLNHRLGDHDSAKYTYLTNTYYVHQIQNLYYILSSEELRIS